MLGGLPWKYVIGNTALQVCDRHVDYFRPTVAEAETQNAAVIFLGDSLSRYWRTHGKSAWSDYFAARNAISLGVSGDRTQHLLFRLRSGVLRKLSPEAIVLQIGTNNVNRNTPWEIAEAIDAITREIYVCWPRTRVILLAIPPREQPRSRKVLERVRKANLLLQERYSKSGHVAFVSDDGAFLAEDGWIKRELFADDGLHLSERGYAVLAPLVNAAL